MMKASEFFYALGASLKSCVKLALQSRHVEPLSKPSKPGDEIFVLANGPSLRESIARYGRLLASRPSVAVNFMANTPEFAEIRPDYYVMADPLFFNGFEHENIDTLWRNLYNVDWPITVMVPVAMIKKAQKLLGNNKNIKVRGFNYIGIEGYAWLERFAYDRHRGMPRPRNVLVPAIMTAIMAGYDKIRIFGADHSWLETVRVDDENHVVSVQPHFYRDSRDELARSEEQYKNVRLHQLLDSFAIAFRSYHTLERYARSRGIEIVNSTPGSFIDAFRRESNEE